MENFNNKNGQNSNLWPAFEAQKFLIQETMNLPKTCADSSQDTRRKEEEEKNIYMIYKYIYQSTLKYIFYIYPNIN